MKCNANDILLLFEMKLSEMIDNVYHRICKIGFRKLFLVCTSRHYNIYYCQKCKNGYEFTVKQYNQLRILVMYINYYPSSDETTIVWKQFPWRLRKRDCIRISIFVLIVVTKWNCSFNTGKQMIGIQSWYLQLPF